MSNLSTCIIYLGLVRSLLNANNCVTGKSGLGKCLMIGIPACSGCGGLITPSGTPGNILIISLLEGAGITLSYLQWVMIFAPLALLTIFICAIWSVTIFKPEKIDRAAVETISEKVQQAGAFSSKEKKTVAIILIMLVCWLLGTWVSFLNVTVVAMLGMVVMFLPGIDVLDWNETAKKINWNLVFTLGSVGVIISGLTGTGIMDWIISRAFASAASWQPILMLLIVGFVVCIIRAFIPTAPAIVALFGAPLLSIAAMTGMSPVTLLIIPAFWACCPMLLWFEPIFLFTYGYNYYKPQDVLKYGSIPSVILVIIMAFLPYYTGIMGF